MATEQTNTKATNKWNIPNDWEVKKLGDLCSTFKSGYGITSEKITTNGNYPVYGGNGLRGYTNIFTHEGEYFLIGRQGALCGNIVTISGKVFVSEHAIAVKTNEKNDNLFLAYKLDYKNLNRLSESSAQPGLSVEKLVSLKIEVPPLHEQKAIAKVLSTMDELIQKNQQLIAQKEQRKKWLMQQLLSEKRIVKNEKWCKSGLKEVFLKEVAKVTMGQSPNSEDYNTEAIGIPLIQGNADLKDRKQVVRYWTRQSHKECDADDIIMTVRAPVGAIGLATQKSSIGRGVCSIKPKSINYWYLYHLLVFKEEQWMKLEQGSTFTAVGSKDIFHFPLFIVHSLKEQTAIAQVLKAADTEISLLKTKAVKLKEQKKGLMQLLLTGKVRLNYDSSDFYDDHDLDFRKEKSHQSHQSKES